MFPTGTFAKRAVEKTGRWRGCSQSHVSHMTRGYRLQKGLKVIETLCFPMLQIIKIKSSWRKEEPRRGPRSTGF